MKPYPLASLHHFTVPFAIAPTSLSFTWADRRPRSPGARTLGSAAEYPRIEQEPSSTARLFPGADAAFRPGLGAPSRSLSERRQERPRTRPHPPVRRQGGELAPGLRVRAGQPEEALRPRQ